MQNSELLKAINTSLIDGTLESKLGLQHKLLVNRPKHKVLTAITNELLTCDEFLISVAFITESGVSQLLNTFKQLEDKGIKGQILTGDYLNFTDPKALTRLEQFSNIEVKLITEKNFHAKGYFFKKEENWNIILGSSNLTQAALTKTEEWNIKLSSNVEGQFVKELLNEYRNLWNNTKNLNYVFEEYGGTYLKKKKEASIKSKLYEQYLQSREAELNVNYTPNQMQKKALSSLQNLRNSGEKKALIISATGTGKTILSAFDVEKFKADKALFIVHRENIARKSLKTYKQIISNKTFGLLTGNYKQLESDYVFATIQTLVKYKEKFPKKYFDYIIIDEVHHGGANTYQEVFNYFEPKFSLGMTATPQRTDGFDIFNMYDNNIAFEYKLVEALHEELLAPFHYFGVSDIEVDGKLIDEKTAVNRLTSDKRTKHIIEKIKFYGYCGEKVHGLIFVSNIQEALQLSENLNGYGYKTKALSGSDSEDVRLKAIDNLESGELEYIITVDIFNEGIDIPCVNQVVLLRPTSSAIVYIQQIGRGLRKTKEKEYVVLIDFIGNYKNNYLIPVAIGNTGSYDKDVLKKEIIMNGIDYLEGESVLQFEEVVQSRLMKQISETNFSTITNIKRDYEYLKLKYGRIPKLMDFVNNDLISPEVILSKSYKNFISVKSKIEKKEFNLTEEQELYLNYFSQVIFPAKRLHEVYIIECLMEDNSITIPELIERINKNYEIDQSDVVKNAILHLSRTIFTSLSDENKYLPFIDINENNIYITDKFRVAIKSELIRKEFNDLITVCKEVFKQDKYDKNQLVTVGKLYNRRQAYKYTLHDFNNGLQVSGYTPFDNEVLVFITLDNSSSFTSYDNALLDSKTLTWFSKGQRRLNRQNGDLTIEGVIAHNLIPLKIFVKRNSSENFYYLGEVHNVVEYEELINDDGKPLVKYKLELDYQLEDELYKYLTLGE